MIFPTYMQQNRNQTQLEIRRNILLNIGLRTDPHGIQKYDRFLCYVGYITNPSYRTLSNNQSKYPQSAHKVPTKETNKAIFTKLPIEENQPLMYIIRQSNRSTHTFDIMITENATAVFFFQKQIQINAKFICTTEIYFRIDFKDCIMWVTRCVQPD